MATSSNPENRLADAADSIRRAVGRSWWVILLFGIASALFGVMALVNPVSAGAGLTWAIGVLALAEGIVGLLGAFNKDAAINRGWMILYAIVSIVFGGMAIANPVSMAASIVMVMAIWFIISGVMRVIFAIRVRKEIDNEWLLILGGVLGVLLGILMLAAPVAGMIVGVIWIGIGALVYGILQIIAAFKVRKLMQ
ncbi:MAG: HdeD family acid-resistance protein [Comamonas sp.]